MKRSEGVSIMKTNATYELPTSNEISLVPVCVRLGQKKNHFCVGSVRNFFLPTSVRMRKNNPMYVATLMADLIVDLKIFLTAGHTQTYSLRFHFN